MASAYNPTTLKKAKIVYNFGLSECRRVKEIDLLSKLFPLKTGLLCRGVCGGRGVWFPAHSNVTCTGKGVKIDLTNQ